MSLKSPSEETEQKCNAFNGFLQTSNDPSTSNPPVRTKIPISSTRINIRKKSERNTPNRTRNLPVCDRISNINGSNSFVHTVGNSILSPNSSLQSSAKKLRISKLPLPTRNLKSLAPAIKPKSSRKNKSTSRRESDSTSKSKLSTPSVRPSSRLKNSIHLEKRSNATLTSHERSDQGTAGTILYFKANSVIQPPQTTLTIQRFSRFLMI